ncbi:GM19451 [Drosophila sechellia]|uniref:GM19451 n=1 Tax=Drosophila sechellia TaxID=7238 RepID=B4I1X8_DROSE|nr:GM19451 [Drosophila sechellia]
MAALEEERLANLPFNTRFNRTHGVRSPASQATKLKVTFMTQTLPTRHHHFHQQWRSSDEARRCILPCGTDFNSVNNFTSTTSAEVADWPRYGYKQCGIGNVGGIFMDLIGGRLETSLAEYLYMVAILDTGYRFLCNGVLIGYKVVLTKWFS